MSKTPALDVVKFNPEYSIDEISEQIRQAYCMTSLIHTLLSTTTEDALPVEILCTPVSQVLDTLHQAHNDLTKCSIQRQAQ